MSGSEGWSSNGTWKWVAGILASVLITALASLVGLTSYFRMIANQEVLSSAPWLRDKPQIVEQLESMRGGMSTLAATQQRILANQENMARDIQNLREELRRSQR